MSTARNTAPATTFGSLDTAAVSANAPPAPTSPGSSMDYTSWDPEQLMREYPEQPKGDVLVRMVEWYTNREVTAKLNEHREKPMHESNYFALLRRGCDNLALRSGWLPGDFRLELDRRRVWNQNSRGIEGNGLSYLRQDVMKRGSMRPIDLPDKPTPDQLAAAHAGRDSRDRWFKLVAALEYHSEGELATAFKLGGPVFHDLVLQAKRYIKVFGEWQEIEARGEKVPQTYIHPQILRQTPGLYTLPPGLGASAGTAIVLSSSSPAKASTKARSPGVKSDAGASLSDDYVTPIRLVSIRVRRTLYRLRDRLIFAPPGLPALDRISYHLERSLECMDHDSDTDGAADQSCETVATLAEYRAFAISCDAVGQHGKDAVAGCVVWAIDAWLEHVEDREQNDGVLSYTFLECLMGVLSNIEHVQAQMAVESMEQDDASDELAAARD